MLGVRRTQVEPRREVHESDVHAALDAALARPEYQWLRTWIPALGKLSPPAPVGNEEAEDTAAPEGSETVGSGEGIGVAVGSVTFTEIPSDHLWYERWKTTVQRDQLRWTNNPSNFGRCTHLGHVYTIHNVSFKCDRVEGHHGHHGFVHNNKVFIDRIAFIDSGDDLESTDTGAKKFDDGKPRYDLVPSTILQECSKVFGFGANKYGDRNWEQGLVYGRLKGAMQRHVEAFWMGEELDPESGLHHLGHAMCCLMMMGEEVLNGDFDRSLDDRPTVERP